MQTTLSDHARTTRRRSRAHPAQLRALRFLQRHLSHVSITGRRTGRPTRQNLSDQAGAGRPRSHRENPVAPRPLPELSQLRNHLPVRCGLSQPAGHRTRCSGCPSATLDRPANVARRLAPGCAQRRAVQGADRLGNTAATPAAGLRPVPQHARRVLLLEGCVQPGLSPNTNAATARVLDRLGLESGAESIIQTASGCGAFIKDYGHLLRDDPLYADKAAVISARSKDLVEVLRDEPLEALGLRTDTRLAFHCPCTLARTETRRRGREASAPAGLQPHQRAGRSSMLRLGGYVFDHATGAGAPVTRQPSERAGKR